MGDAPPLAAATVVLLRDGPDGPETLLLRRNSRLAFGPDAWVFPGGRVDAGDVDPDAPEDEERAARRAAAREAAEEAAVAVTPGDLVPFAHWTPPTSSPRRFVTWFFLVGAPAAAVVVDGGEIVDHEWVRPADVLTRHAAGEFQFLAPTYQSVFRLAAFATVADALDDARSSPVPRFATHLVQAGADVEIALWAGDAGYDTSDHLVEGPRHRLVMGPRPWRYERP